MMIRFVVITVVRNWGRSLPRLFYIINHILLLDEAMVKLKKKLLKSYLREKYGKRQGKKLFKGIRKELKKEHGIK